ncbi:hypothetical protein [Streptodolium elevatio]|uniref:LigA protein n=1 Tax=Streptodolium elevatio TaxID=3157996 RepID=A0ABV3D8P7_9ACTN
MHVFVKGVAALVVASALTGGSAATAQAVEAGQHASARLGGASAGSWSESVLPMGDAQATVIARPDAFTTWVAGSRAGVLDGPKPRLVFSPVLVGRDARDGGIWREIALPQLPAGSDVQVHGADASSARSGMLVGDFDPLLEGMLTERWDGASWRVIPAPVPESTLGAGLLDVDEISPRDAWAVGYAEILDGVVIDPVTGRPQQLSHTEPVVRHWDGTAWQVVATPPIADGGILLSVTALAPDDVWAVGRSMEMKPVIMHYDGTAWTSVPVSVPNGELRDVVARGPHEVWAVGGTRDTDGTLDGLVLRFDGHTWQRVTLPDGVEMLDQATAVRGGFAAVGNREGDDTAFAVALENGRLRSLNLAVPAGTTASGINGAGPELLVTAYRTDTTSPGYRPIPLLLTGCR